MTDNQKYRRSRYQAYRTPSGKVRYRGAVQVDGRRYTKSFHSAHELQVWKGKMELARRSARIGENEAPPLTFREIIERWSVEHLDVEMSPSMRVLNRQLIKAQFSKKFDDRVFREILPEEWAAHLNELFKARGWSNATYNRRRSLFSSIYNWAIKMNLVSINPLERVPEREEMGAQRRFLTEEQMRTVLDLVVQSPHCICFDLLVNTGMRISEALGLRWCDVDFTHRSIRLARIYCPAVKDFVNRTKGGEARTLPMNAALYGALMCERNRGHHISHDDLVVVKADGTTPKHSGIRNLFEKILIRLGLEPEGIHIVRHSFASFFMMSGGKLWDLKTILGHSSIDVTERYAHFSLDHLRQQAEQVSFERRKPGGANLVDLSARRSGEVPQVSQTIRTFSAHGNS